MNYSPTVCSFTYNNRQCCLVTEQPWRSAMRHVYRHAYQADNVKQCSQIWTDRQTGRQTGGGTDGQSEYLSVTSCAHVWNRRRLPREVHFNAGCWMQRSLELSICEATTVGAIARLICGHICQQATTTATTTTTTRTAFLTNLTKKATTFQTNCPPRAALRREDMRGLLPQFDATILSCPKEAIKWEKLYHIEHKLLFFGMQNMFFGAQIIGTSLIEKFAGKRIIRKESVSQSWWKHVSIFSFPQCFRIN